MSEQLAKEAADRLVNQLEMRLRVPGNPVYFDKVSNDTWVKRISDTIGGYTQSAADWLTDKLKPGPDTVLNAGRQYISEKFTQLIDNIKAGDPTTLAVIGALAGGGLGLLGSMRKKPEDRTPMWDMLRGAAGMGILGGAGGLLYQNYLKKPGLNTGAANIKALPIDDPLDQSQPRNLYPVESDTNTDVFADTFRKDQESGQLQDKIDILGMATGKGKQPDALQDESPLLTAFSDRLRSYDIGGVPLPGYESALMLPFLNRFRNDYEIARDPITKRMTGLMPRSFITRTSWDDFVTNYQNYLEKDPAAIQALKDLNAAAPTGGATVTATNIIEKMRRASEKQRKAFIEDVDYFLRNKQYMDPQNITGTAKGRPNTPGILFTEEGRRLTLANPPSKSYNANIYNATRAEKRFDKQIEMDSQAAILAANNRAKNYAQRIKFMTDGNLTQASHIFSPETFDAVARGQRGPLTPDYSLTGQNPTFRGKSVNLTGGLTTYVDPKVDKGKPKLKMQGGLRRVAGSGKALAGTAATTYGARLLGLDDWAADNIRGLGRGNALTPEGHKFLYDNAQDYRTYYDNSNIGPQDSRHYLDKPIKPKEPGFFSIFRDNLFGQ